MVKNNYSKQIEKKTINEKTGIKKYDHTPRNHNISEKKSCFFNRQRDLLFKQNYKDMMSR